MIGTPRTATGFTLDRTMMKKQTTVQTNWLGLLLLCCIGLWSNVAEAQFFGGGGGFPGFGGGGGGGQAAARQTAGSGNPVGSADISFDPETRSIIAVTDDKTLAEIKKIIAGLDRPSPQVLIKIVFLEATYTKDSDIGINGGYTKTFRTGSSYTNILSQGFGTAGTSAAALVAPGAGIYSILSDDFQATLRAIATAGKTEVLSRPSVLTRNNQLASISLGQQVPIISGTRFDTFGNQINTVSYQNVGVNLSVTPFISSEGMVEMVLTPEISSLADRSQWVPISGGTNGGALAPLINSRNATTTVVVPDGQTVVIGGLMENQVQESESKVPGFGDIPLLGNLFKRKTKSNVKRELMIFVTPHIVKQPGQLAAMSEAERANKEMAPNAFSEQQ